MYLIELENLVSDLSFLKAETNFLRFVIYEFGIKRDVRNVDIIKAFTPRTSIWKSKSY